MSPALNRSSAIWRFEGSDAIKICDGITFDFYMGLPHIVQASRVAILLVNIGTRLRDYVTYVKCKYYL